MNFNIPNVNTPSPHWQYFKMLYQDIEKSFEYVHPTDEHFKVYSLRHYEYLLRACTEFESVCKGEMIKNNLAKSRDYLTIKNYSTLETFYKRKLSSYEVGFRFLPIYFVRPLEAWANGESLIWYQNYNTVKHHRAGEFSHANLKNVLSAVAGLFLILLAAELCPQAELAFDENNLLRWNAEWPVVIKKDSGEQVSNSINDK
jgi:hypothetical protein